MSDHSGTVCYHSYFNLVQSDVVNCLMYNDSDGQAITVMCFRRNFLSTNVSSNILIV